MADVKKENEEVVKQIIQEDQEVNKEGKGRNKRNSISIEASSEAEPAHADELVTATEGMFTSAKLALHAVLVLFLYIWWDMFGIWLAPLYAYFVTLLVPVSSGKKADKATQMQVRSVVIIYFSILTMPLLSVWIFTKCSWFMVTGLFIYMGWYTFLDKAPKKGGRFVHSLRQRTFWRHFASYFPIRLTRTAELDKERKYIFGYHPHGIISVGALCNFATEATGFGKLFPGINLRLLTLEMNFRIPFFREYLLGMGINDASRESIKGNLRRGNSVMLVVGGARESLETKPGHADLVLSNRKGFVKLALQEGASLVPVFSFGENDVFGVYHSDKAMKFQLRMQKKLGFAIPMFYGRALTGGLLHKWFGLDVGIMPLRMPVHSIVGRPVHLEKVESPTQEQIDEAHTKYMVELKKVYEAFQDEFAKEREEALSTHGSFDAERVKILKSAKFHLDDMGDLSFEVK